MDAFNNLDPKLLVPDISPEGDRGWLQVWWDALKRRRHGRSDRDAADGPDRDGSTAPDS